MNNYLGEPRQEIPAIHDIPQTDFIPTFLRAVGDSKNWRDSQRLASVKQHITSLLESQVKVVPNAPYIEIRDLGYLNVPDWVVVELSQPGIVLGSSFGIMAAKRAIDEVSKSYGLPENRLDLISWIGTAKEAIERIQRSKSGK